MPASPAPAFTPTAAQLRLLDYVHANPGFQRITDLCAESGVDPSSYYKWCHDPAFKQWLTAEWSSRLLFEGWHFLNLARANCTNSTAHFRVLMNLIFDPKGQAALAAWQKLASAPVEAAAASPACPQPEFASRGEGLPGSPIPASDPARAAERSAAGGPRPINVESQPLRNQQNGTQNSSFSAFSLDGRGPQARLNPGMVARHLHRQISRLQPRKRDIPARPRRPRPDCHARSAQSPSPASSAPLAKPAPGGAEPPPQPPQILLELANFDFSNPYARPPLRKHFADASRYLRGLSRSSPKKPGPRE